MDDVEIHFDQAALHALLTSSEVAKDLERRGLQVEARAKILMSTPGTGRTYRRRGITHRASSPGEPPAPDTGQARASITHAMGQDGEGLFVDVGSNLKTVKFLEFGTQHMAARPALRPALEAGQG